MNAPVEFSIARPVDDEMVARVGDIFACNDNPKSSAHLSWQYLHSPAGQGYTSVSVSDSGDDAAIYSVFKVKAKVDGVLVDACQSLDTLTDKNYRGMGLFSKLAKDVYRRSDEDGVRMTYGFPNSSSGPGFFGKLGWIKLGFPPFLFFMNNLLFPLARATGKRFFLRNHVFLLVVMVTRWLSRNDTWRLAEKPDFSPAYDVLWQAVSEQFNTCVWRDGDYMRWRYLGKPGCQYRYLSLYEGDGLIGVLVYVVLEKHGGKIGYVMDLVVMPGKKAAARYLLASGVQAMSSAGVDVVLAWSAAGSVTRPAYSSLLFLPMPRRVQPIKLFFGYRPGPGMKRPLSPDDFFVSYADSDTV